jgi:transposase-like protein
MRYPACEKLELVQLVEQSHLPVRRTLKKLGIPRATFYRWYDLYHTGGPAGLAAPEARNAAERHAQLRQRPQRPRPQDPSSQPDNEIIFLREDDEDNANELSPTIQFISPKGDTNEA